MSGTPSDATRRNRVSDEELASALPTRGAGQEARVGIFVLVGLISFVVVLFLLTDPATMRGRRMIVTTVGDAGGVRRGDPVQMRGVIIGRINGFDMMESGQVAIRMELEGEWDIPIGSTTRLGAPSLFGGRTMEVIPTDATDYHAEWDTLPGEAVSSGLVDSAEELSGKATTVLERLETLMEGGTIASVQGSAAELQTLLSDLSAVVAEQRGTLRDLTASLSRSAEGFEEVAGAGPDAARAIARADSAMAVLAATGENLDRAATSLRNLLDRIDRGEGTLGRLATDQALYDNLNEAVLSVTALVEDLKANPRRYINVSIF